MHVFVTPPTSPPPPPHLHPPPLPRHECRQAPSSHRERKSTAVRDQALARAPARSLHGNYVWVGLELCRLWWKIRYFKYGIS